MATPDYPLMGVEALCGIYRHIIIVSLSNYLHLMKFLCYTEVKPFAYILSPLFAKGLQTIIINVTSLNSHFLLSTHIYTGAHEPPEGRQGASNYVQRHLILSGSETFLIWTFPQVGNLPMWSLRIRVKQAQPIYCLSSRTERVWRFRARDVQLHERILMNV